MSRTRLVSTLILSLGILAGAGARAEDRVPDAADLTPKPATATAKTVDAEGYEAVLQGELMVGEQLPANKLVAGAYGFILACLVVWIASVAVRSRKVEEELEALRARIDKRG